MELYAALAGLAVHRGDWETVERQTQASADLAEREGLAGKLCFPYSMRGILLWRAGELDEAASGWSAPSSSPTRSAARRSPSSRFTGSPITRRDEGRHADADQTLARALDLCERAGLVAQSVEAIAARSVNAALWGKREQASELATEAASLAERLRYPVGGAASTEARGAAAGLR